MGKSKDDEGLDPEVERIVDDLLGADKVIERYRERCVALGRDPEFDPPSLVDRMMLMNTTILGKLGGAAGPGGLSPEAIMSHLDKLRKGLFEEVKAHVESIVSSRSAYTVPVPRPARVVGTPPSATPEEEAALDEELAAMGKPSYKELLVMSPLQAYSELVDYRARKGAKSNFVAASEMADVQYAFESDVATPAEAAALDRAVAKDRLAKATVRLTPAKVHADFEDTLFRASIDIREAKRTLELLLTTPEGNEMLQLMVYDAVIIKRKKAEKGKNPKG